MFFSLLWLPKIKIQKSKKLTLAKRGDKNSIKALFTKTKQSEKLKQNLDICSYTEENKLDVLKKEPI